MDTQSFFDWNNKSDLMIILHNGIKDLEEHLSLGLFILNSFDLKTLLQEY